MLIIHNVLREYSALIILGVDKHIMYKEIEVFMSKTKVGVLGATAYTGVELIKRIVNHPGIEIVFISSQSYAEKKFSDVFGEMKGIFEDVLIAPEKAEEQEVECIFSCLPHAVSADLCMPFIKKGVKIIDLSADFRIENAETYEDWYDHKHPSPELLEDAVYGLCEHYRDQIKKTQVLANPGCYPTSILLPLLPLLKNDDVEVTSVIADSKSGVSGAGRKLKLGVHYVEANENFSAYAIGRSHRHIAEIDQELSKASEKNMQITFSPHLTPINRGILSTIYIGINKSAEECLSIAKAFYKDEPFVRVRESEDMPQIKYVANTNYCDFTFTGGKDGSPVIAVSTIDNLIKGASGQAIQNFNIMFGYRETECLI